MKRTFLISFRSMLNQDLEPATTFSQIRGYSLIAFTRFSMLGFPSRVLSPQTNRSNNTNFVPSFFIVNNEVVLEQTGQFQHGDDSWCVMSGLPRINSMWTAIHWSDARTLAMSRRSPTFLWWYVSLIISSPRFIDWQYKKSRSSIKKHKRYLLSIARESQYLPGSSNICQLVPSPDTNPTLI